MRKQVEEAAKELDASLSSKLRLVERAQLIGPVRSGKISGWRVQQALKLACYKACSSPLILILDSKNIFIRETRYEDFADGSGVPKTHLFKYQRKSDFWRLLFGSSEYIGVPAPVGDSQLGYPTTTPNTIIACILKELHDLIVNRHGRPLGEAFLEEPALQNVTEFLLYHAMLEKKGGIKAHYTLREPICHTFFATSPVGDEAIKSRLLLLDDPKVKLTGLHRKRVGRLTTIERDTFVDIFMRSGIILRAEDFSDFEQSHLSRQPAVE